MNTPAFSNPDILFRPILLGYKKGKHIYATEGENWAIVDELYDLQDNKIIYYSTLYVGPIELINKRLKEIAKANGLKLDLRFKDYWNNNFLGYPFEKIGQKTIELHYPKKNHEP